MKNIINHIKSLEVKVKKQSAFDILNDAKYEALSYSDCTSKSRETYDLMIKRGYLDACPTSMTVSSVFALRAVVNNNLEDFNYYLDAAENFPSILDGCGITRSKWIRKMARKLNPTFKFI